MLHRLSEQDHLPDGGVTRQASRTCCSAAAQADASGAEPSPSLAVSRGLSLVGADTHLAATCSSQAMIRPNSPNEASTVGMPRVDCCRWTVQGDQSPSLIDLAVQLWNFLILLVHLMAPQPERAGACPGTTAVGGSCARTVEDALEATMPSMFLRERSPAEQTDLSRPGRPTPLRFVRPVRRVLPQAARERRAGWWR